jgi:invasion protein IalB
MFSTRERSGPAGLSTTTAVLAALLAFAAVPAAAQEAPAEPAQPAQATEQPAQPAQGQGQANAQPAVPQPEWQKVCGQIKDQQECHTSRQRVAATGQPLAQFMIIERGDKKLVQVAVPPVALIQPGIQLKIDDSEPTGVKYVVCTPGECLALGEITADYISRLKRGNTLVVSMLNPQGKAVNFDLSLSGFTATYDGPGMDPSEAQAKQQKLEDELKRKADAARQQLLQLQQQQSSTQ